ncbi:MAG: radical SAM protein [Candidatus Omnitrophica bacterium]|nr:radical SAM protein [Candidatus Omnitrophota bacterium]
MPSSRNAKKIETIRKANKLLKDSLKSCYICPRKCGVDRTKSELCYCRASLDPAVYSYSPHHGEEPPLSGSKGSGTIFFSGCNMKCVYCQNYYFSQLDNGERISVEKLADIMLYLQKMRCHNINLVSPTHYVPQIVMALEIALGRGLRLPIVYNTGGYDLVDTIKLLCGIVDIYMPDMRYSDDEMAKIYSDAPQYVKYNRDAVSQMRDQVGDLVLDENGIAKRGLIVRLLALPEEVSGTKATLKFIKDKIGENTYLSIMSQYYPTFKAYNYSEISRPIRRDEYQNIVDEAKDLGLNNGWIQEAPSEFDSKFFGTNIKPKTGV